MLLTGSLGDITKTDILNFCDCEDDCCEIEEVNFMRSTEFVVDPANAQKVRQAEYNYWVRWYSNIYILDIM